MKLSILIVILSFTFFLGIISAEDCGFGDELCPGHLCCSNGGKCGSSRYYCGNSCFSQCWDQEREDHRCGPDFGDAPCGENRCCSRSGWCGSGYDFCSDGDCQYRCFYSLSSTLTQSETKENSISGILSASLFDEMFKHRKDCPSQGFYSYDAFINATTSFPSFGRVGDLATRKRELAAFLAQTSQATSGGLIDSVDPHAWGYCHIDTTIATSANNMNNYCTSTNSPCVSGKKYNSRGPIQLTHNYNYGLAGAALGLDLLNNPDLVATDPVVSFKTAIWFWMTRHDNKTSCHNVLINADSKPRDALSYCLSDGYLTNGAHGNLNRLGSNIVTTTVGYYKRYCDMLDVSYGHWLPSKVTRIQISVL